MRTGIVLLVVAVLLGVLVGALEVRPPIGKLVTVGAVIVGVVGIVLVLLGALGMLGL